MSRLAWDTADTATGERQSAETYTTCTSMDAGWFHTLAPMEGQGVERVCVLQHPWRNNPPAVRKTGSLAGSGAHRRSSSS